MTFQRLSIRSETPLQSLDLTNARMDSCRPASPASPPERYDMIRLLMAALSLVGLLHSPAFSQSSSVTLSPDGQFALVQKNVGDQRWAIVQDRNNRKITGNVFSTSGGPAQFIWCDWLGGTNYRCSGSSGCFQQPCSWSTIGTVSLSDSFLSVPGGQPTPRPSSVPTPRPTNPPSSGLQGLIGTWDMTYRIVSQYVDTLRLRSLGSAQGIPVVVGVNEIGGTIVGGKADDIFPENTVSYEWAVVDIGPIICQAYIFDRSGDSATGRYYIATHVSDECGTFLGAYPMTGVRTSRSASVASEATGLERMAYRRLRRLRAFEDRGARRGQASEVTRPQAADELGRMGLGGMVK